jgi:hypothetical protein
MPKIKKELIRALVEEPLADSYGECKRRRDNEGEIYSKPDWAVEQVTRVSGLVEDVCKHGVGHPNVECVKDIDPDGKRGLSVHGCDGCCFGRGPD